MPYDDEESRRVWLTHAAECITRHAVESLEP